MTNQEIEELTKRLQDLGADIPNGKLENFVIKNQKDKDAVYFLLSEHLEEESIKRRKHLIALSKQTLKLRHHGKAI